jgi:DNA replication initiation complex subunit (GINS family)
MRKSTMQHPTETVDEAVSAIRRDYYSDVSSMAKDLAERMKAGEIEDFEDALHEDCDGCARVIYTFQAKLGLLASDNEDAAEDSLGEHEAKLLSPEQRMFFALEADIRQELNARGVDPSEPDSWPDIDLGEFK